MGDIFDYVKRQATPVFNELLSSTNIGVEVIYKIHSGQSFDSSAGANIDQYKNRYLNAVETFHTDKSAVASQRGVKPGSDVQAGDRVFIFFSGIPTSKSMKDQVEMEDGTTYRVKAILKINGIATVVTVDS